MESIVEFFCQEGYKTVFTYNNTKTICTESLDGFSVRLIEKEYKKMISTKLINYKNRNKYRDYLINNKESIHLISKEINRQNPKIILDFDNYIFNEILIVCARYLNYIEIRMERINVNKYIDINNIQIEKYDNLLFVYIKEKSKKYYQKYFSNINDENYKIILNEIKLFLEYLGLNAKNMIQAKKYDLVISNKVAGILYHEACGHQFELSKNNTLYSLIKYGENYNFCNENLTIRDIGFKNISSELYDDEGSLKKEIVLIDKGKVKSPLTDLKSLMNFNNYEKTGNCRRESYRFYPEARMYCTLIENGNESVANMISQVNYGLYISSISEAYLDHKLSLVYCIVDRANVIKNGKITNIIVKCILEEDAMTILKNTSAISDDSYTNSGYCNSNSGNIYVEYGSPTMYLKKINMREVCIYDK